MTTPESELTVEELRIRAQNAQDDRLRFLDTVEPPLTPEEQQQLDNLTRFSLDATAAYIAAQRRAEE